jgi:hypothetical protein
MTPDLEQNPSEGKLFPYEDIILGALFDEEGLAFVLFMRARSTPVMSLNRILVQGTRGTVYDVADCVVKGIFTRKFVLTLIDQHGKSIKFVPSDINGMNEGSATRALAVASSSASYRKSTGDDYWPTGFWAPMTKEKLAETLFLFGFFSKSETRQNAETLVSIAEGHTASCSPSKLSTFERYFPRASYLWSYVLNILNCYYVLRVLGGKLSDTEYRNLLLAVPKAIESKAGMGERTATGFTDFIAELRADFEKTNNTITKGFLGVWAVKHLDGNHFPAEIGI